MKKALVSAQILLSLILIAAIILQARGTGLGNVWGGGGVSYHSKRGLEKILFWVTIVSAALFLIASIFNILVK